MLTVCDGIWKHRGEDRRCQVVTLVKCLWAQYIIAGMREARTRIFGRQVAQRQGYMATLMWYPKCGLWRELLLEEHMGSLGSDCRQAPSHWQLPADLCQRVPVASGVQSNLMSFSSQDTGLLWSTGLFQLRGKQLSSQNPLFVRSEGHSDASLLMQTQWARLPRSLNSRGGRAEQTSDDPVDMFHVYPDKWK